MLCCGCTLTDFPISIRLTSLALWQSNDCPSPSKATLMNMDKYFMWIHYERLHNHNKAKHNKTVCIFLGIYCIKCQSHKDTESSPEHHHCAPLCTCTAGKQRTSYWPGGSFKNTYELLNQRALKFSYVNEIHIFQCMGKIFCVELQRYPLKFHTKYLTHTLKDMIFMQFWNFKSS